MDWLTGAQGRTALGAGRFREAGGAGRTHARIPKQIKDTRGERVGIVEADNILKLEVGKRDTDLK